MVERHDGFRRHEPQSRCNDERAWNVGWRRRERLRVGQLSTKIQAADKRERVAEWSALGAEPDRQVERRARAEEHRGALASGVGRRQQEDAMAAHGRFSAATWNASFSPCVTV